MTTAQHIVDVLLGEADEPRPGLSPSMKAAAKQAAKGIHTQDPLARSWTGNDAVYVSPSGNHGTVGYSELAMHTGIAGKPILRYALFKSSDGRINWAQVETERPNAPDHPRVTDGTVGELLPHELRRKHEL